MLNTFFLENYLKDVTETWKINIMNNNHTTSKKIFIVSNSKPSYTCKPIADCTT